MHPSLTHAVLTYASFTQNHEWAHRALMLANIKRVNSSVCRVWIISDSCSVLNPVLSLTKHCVCLHHGETRLLRKLRTFSRYIIQVAYMMSYTYAALRCPACKSDAPLRTPPLAGDKRGLRMSSERSRGIGGTFCSTPWNWTRYMLPFNFCIKRDLGLRFQT